MSDMAKPDDAVERDERFPSGPWIGFFDQPMAPAGRHKTELQLRFQDGKMTGDGVDWVGPYKVLGCYRLEDGRCEWLKEYIGKHTVVYAGYNEEGMGIYGGWMLTATMRGSFRIWPAGLEEEVATDLDADLDEPQYNDIQHVPDDELVPC